PAPEADLVVLKTDGRTKFYSDEEATYSITIFNAGPSVAYNVHVTDPLPAGIALMSWTASSGDMGTGPLDVTIPEMAVGELATFTVTIQIPANYHISNTNLINTVSVSSDTPDPNPACPGCTDNNTPAERFVTVETNMFSLEELV